MKVEDFQSRRQPAENDIPTGVIPGQMTVEECIASVQQDEAEATETVYTSLTPSGIEVAYSPAPRRHYKLRWAGTDAYRAGVSPPNDVGWEEVPSVTTVLGVLDKPALTWWGMKVGVEGYHWLLTSEEGPLTTTFDGWHVVNADLNSDVALDPSDIVELLTKHKLTVNHVKDKAADRGTSVHKAFEAWCENPEYRPDPELFEENERGYICALANLLDDLDDAIEIESEVMVGSIEHGFAGRYDCRLTLEEDPDRRVVTKCYPKRDPKFSEIPHGKWLLDLKTSKSIYPTHALQLAAYELASVECGYGPTDYRAVLHLQSDGQYELVQTHATGEDFLSVLATYQTMQKAKEWM